MDKSLGIGIEKVHHTLGNLILGLTRFGVIARWAQGNLRNLLRADTPHAVWLLALRASG